MATAAATGRSSGRCSQQQHSQQSQLTHQGKAREGKAQTARQSLTLIHCPLPILPTGTQPSALAWHHTMPTHHVHAPRPPLLVLGDTTWTYAAHTLKAGVFRHLTSYGLACQYLCHWVAALAVPCATRPLLVCTRVHPC